MKKIKKFLKKVWNFLEFVEQERIKCMYWTGQGKV